MVENFDCVDNLTLGMLATEYKLLVKEAHLSLKLL
jgi:hypothetical protein